MKQHSTKDIQIERMSVMNARLGKADGFVSLSVNEDTHVTTSDYPLFDVVYRGAVVHQRLGILPALEFAETMRRPDGVITSYYPKTFNRAVLFFTSAKCEVFEKYDDGSEGLITNLSDLDDRYRARQSNFFVMGVEPDSLAQY